MAAAMPKRVDIDTHSTLERHDAELKKAQQEVREKAPPPTPKKAEDRRSEIVAHLAASARQAQVAQQQEAVTPPEIEEGEEPEATPKGIPGLGPMVRDTEDSRLASVNVVHVRNLPPENVKGLKETVGKMRQ